VVLVIVVLMCFCISCFIIVMKFMFLGLMCSVLGICMLLKNSLGCIW